MFRKRVNSTVERDFFTFQQTKTVQQSRNGVDFTCTVHPLVNSRDVVFEPCTPMLSVTDCLKAGIQLKEVNTDGVLDSSDSLDYNMEGVEERVLDTLEKASKKMPKKQSKTSKNDKINE
jgi:hypothetical protein